RKSAGNTQSGKCPGKAPEPAGPAAPARFSQLGNFSNWDRGYAGTGPPQLRGGRASCALRALCALAASARKRPAASAGDGRNIRRILTAATGTAAPLTTSY